MAVAAVVVAAGEGVADAVDADLQMDFALTPVGPYPTDSPSRDTEETSVKRSSLILLLSLAALFVGAVEPAPPGGVKGKAWVGAYYYPWYRAPRAENTEKKRALGWMKQALRGRLVPRQLPKLGVYSSREPAVIADHIAQSRRGNIDFWVVSWWGPGTKTDVAFKNHILKHPDAGKLKYALFYEPTGRLGKHKEPDYSSFLGDFDYMREHYYDHRHYLKIDGRPVVFVYLTRVYFRNKGLDTLAALRKKQPALYIVGDDVFGSTYRAKYADLWDAVTAYDVYGQSLARDGATREALNRLKANYTTARRLANSVGTAFIPAVSPGFNDRAVREGHAGRARYFKDARKSREGDVFREMLRNVGLPLVDPRCENMIMVTSFNEWYEDTQIEATAGTESPSRKDDSESGTFYTEGETYADYGTLYLDILREETQRVGRK